LVTHKSFKFVNVFDLVLCHFIVWLS